jgi:hypothetical protein
LFGANEPFPKSPDKTVNSSSEEYESKTTDSAEGKIKDSVHNDSLKDNVEGKNPPSGDSITKTPEISKSTYNPAKQIGAQVDYDKKRAEKVAYNDKINALNGNNSEMIAGQKADLAAFDGAHDAHIFH